MNAVLVKRYYCEKSPNDIYTWTCRVDYRNARYSLVLESRNSRAVKRKADKNVIVYSKIVKFYVFKKMTFYLEFPFLSAARVFL